MVVTATRTERSLADQPDSVTVVTRQQIQETPAQSLDDVLRTIPSIDLPLTASYQVHPTANSVSMRGLGGIRALVLLDGVPINDPFFGYIQWNRVPMENVERVEVVRGGGRHSGAITRWAGSSTSSRVFPTRKRWGSKREAGTTAPIVPTPTA